MEASERIKVVVRCRPLLGKEHDLGHKNVVKIDSKRGSIHLLNILKANYPPKVFTFDAVYSFDSKQQDIYDESFRPLVDSVLNGFNGTIFAYGQTGTGKTYTMEGEANIPELRGVIPLSFNQIFTHIFSQSLNDKESPAQKQYLVKASYLEIYNEQLRDLLTSDLDDSNSFNYGTDTTEINGSKENLHKLNDNKKHAKKLEVRERLNDPRGNVYIKGLRSIVTKNIEEIQHVMKMGNANRVTGCTNMNERSSRSHALFMITIECSELGEDGKNHIRVGKLNLVDLAGSERQTKTGAVGDRLKESTKINLSLCALGNVISAITDGKNSHIPYRDSKLTRILQNSLGGNAKTIMVANIGPSDYNYDETLMTLRYANRAKNIKNKPVINEDPKDATLRKYQIEIERLKAILAEKQVQQHQHLTSSAGSSISRKKKKKREKNVTGVGEKTQVIENAWEDLTSRIKLLENERVNILNDHHLIKEEKSKLLTQLEEREKMLCEEEIVQAKLLQRIKEIESKLLSGNIDLLRNYQTKQEQDLMEKRKLIAEEKRKEREILQKLEEAEENTLESRETYNNLQQEIEMKTKKLKKLFLKYRSLKSETEDMKDLNAKELQELFSQQRELIKESKFKLMVIENFVPAEVKMKFLKFAYYDQDLQEWKLLFDPKNLARLRAKRKGLTANILENGIKHESQNNIEGNTQIPPKPSDILNEGKCKDNQDSVNSTSNPLGNQSFHSNTLSELSTNSSSTSHISKEEDQNTKNDPKTDFDQTFDQETTANTTLKFLQNVFCAGLLSDPPDKKNHLQIAERTGLIKRPLSAAYSLRDPKNPELDNSSHAAYKTIGLPASTLARLNKHITALRKRETLLGSTKNKMENNTASDREKSNIRQQLHESLSRDLLNLEERERMLPCNVLPIPCQYLNISRPKYPTESSTDLSDVVKTLTLEEFNLLKPSNIHIVDCLALLNDKQRSDPKGSKNSIQDIPNVFKYQNARENNDENDNDDEYERNQSTPRHSKNREKSKDTRHTTVKKHHRLPKDR